ncbi:hypothetical protein [uncultured phage MedDCM-OCT-S05-C113]|nr:hypothetical protein [uncultured phage MedDCM-OCT-S05-C113]
MTITVKEFYKQADDSVDLFSWLITEGIHHIDGDLIARMFAKYIDGHSYDLFRQELMNQLNEDGELVEDEDDRS